jgi:RNA polymerase sigma-70 factor (ECF subfamily)
MIRAWQRWGRVSKMDKPSAWGRKVLVNLAIGRWRRRRAYAPYVERDVAAPPRDEDHLDLARALRRLPDTQRQAILLHDVVGLMVSETAREMGVPEGSVRGWLSRGRRTLAIALGDTPDRKEERKAK